MSGIDYSKWDKIETSSDEESEKLSSGCNVTRFDSPQSITFGGQGERDEIDVVSSSRKINESKIESGHVSRDRVLSLDEYVFGGKSKCDKSYYWTQTENNLTLLLEVDQNIQNKQLKVNVTEDKVNIIYGLETVLNEEFEHQVKDDENTIFWSIKQVESFNKELNKKINKMLVIELEKKEISTSIKLWWKRIFKGGIETDISKFNRYLSSNKEEKNKKFLQAWEEAHNEFRNKIKNRQKMII